MDNWYSLYEIDYRILPCFSTNKVLCNTSTRTFRSIELILHGDCFEKTRMKPHYNAIIWTESAVNDCLEQIMLPGHHFI